MDLIVVLLDIVLIIVVIVLKSYLLLWLAARKNWENNLQRSFLTNIYWLLILIGISILFVFTLPLLFIALNVNYYQDFLWSTFFNLIFFALNFIVGYLLISYFYNGSHIDSFVITLILLIAERALIKIFHAVITLIFSLNFGFYDGIYVFRPY